MCVCFFLLMFLVCSPLSSLSFMIVFPFLCSALICMKNAPNIPAKNFHALTRLDENRAKCQVK